MSRGKISRRGFLGGSGGVVATVALPLGVKKNVALILDPSDPMVGSDPVRLAVLSLEFALRGAGFAVVRKTQAPPGTFCIVASVATAREDRLSESFMIRRNGATVVAVGGDARGLSFAVRELAERVRSDPKTAFVFAEPLVERPINPVRSVMRQFTSATYDKTWFNDRTLWPQYLAMLADQRFNRLHLAFGLGYDSLAHVVDSYFLFTYPFLVDVPGYGVRVGGLADAERDRNLAMLRFISEQTVAHGLEFQLGLWMHGYQWPAAPGVSVIEGLAPDIHAAYCRDALALLLKQLPAVSSVALRIHGESGVKEGSYGFWKTVFAGVGTAGRPVEIDLHAKGIDQPMIDNALATGMPVNISPKFWGEHLGMPYHQAAIREFEMPAPGQVGKGLLTLSEGARSFTRYGYADLLRDDRQYTVRHRVFPGTQHLLASSVDAAYGSLFGFCGSTGADLMEPLTYRGRRGSAVETSARSGYTAAARGARWDWQKYQAWYRSFGRSLYNPQTASSANSRPSGDALTTALAAASRILPLVTTAYAPSAACDAYWPEVYWNQSLIGEPSANPYTDNVAPKVFDNASPFDPQLFSSMREHAGALLERVSGKISPIQVASWLEGFAVEAEQALVAAGPPSSSEAARLHVDIAIQAGLGRFFGAKFRAGVLFALFSRSQDRRAGESAVGQYEKARAAWADIVRRADGVYGDVSSSDIVSEHGAWADKLPAIDTDIAALKDLLSAAVDGNDMTLTTAIAAALATSVLPPPPMSHQAPAGFTPGTDLPLTFAALSDVTAAKLWFRHVNQAERWQSVAMSNAGGGGVWQAAIPAAYTASAVFPLQYYVEATEALQSAFLYPGLTAQSSLPPYITLQRRPL